MLMVHALNTRRVDLADSHLGAAVSESKDGEWHPSPDTRIAFLNYNEYCLLLKTYIAAGKSDPAMRQRLKEEHTEISPELENLLEKVSE
ncbi:pentatricopeptide repeat-containing protein [Pyrus ussuriensis x Pyrus communis]|uniref:Pentatricopeptide repeat-containing protein n=1 Tax=Pyrus ussuriensis x Pyrus communis TaxID=2448454 RepID=A0A5N5G976_9ROSA|nr:pentatricopeptide repeat-containing protein [Pyrus ussuriensis x Pyrus communis]